MASLLPEKRHIRVILVLICSTVVLVMFHLSEKDQKGFLDQQVATFRHLGSKWWYANKHNTTVSIITRLEKVLESEDGGFVNVTYDGPYAFKSPPSKSAMRVPSWIFREVISPPRYVTLDEEMAVREVVFLTAANPAYFRKVLATIQTAQEYFPSKPIIFYDLGLLKDQVQTIQSLCGVEYNKFNFSQYPEHFQHLKFYAWKPVVIYQTLRRFPGVLWIDASVRFTSSSTVPFREAVQYDGFLFLHSGFHSTFAVTHPGMYDFLPTNMTLMKTNIQRGGGFVILFRTKYVYEQIVQWAVFCALDRRCIASSTTLHCPLSHRIFNVYANCHRFDQSLLNILSINCYAEIPKFPSVEIGVIRRTIDFEKENAVKRCP